MNGGICQVGFFYLIEYSVLLKSLNEDLQFVTNLKIVFNVKIIIRSQTSNLSEKRVRISAIPLKGYMTIYIQTVL